MIETRAHELAGLKVQAAHSKWKYNISALIRELSHEYRLYLKRLRSSAQNNGMLFDEVFVNEFYRIEKHLRLLASLNAQGGTRGLMRMPGSGMPRILMLCKEYISICNAALDINSLTLFFDRYQDEKPLAGREVELIGPMLSVAVLEYIRDLVHSSASDSVRAAALQTAINSLSRLTDADVETGITALSRVNAMLCRDACYRRMDASGKRLYMEAVEKLADRCASDETEVAMAALELSEAEAGRRAHVGYYLINEGKNELIARLSGVRKISVLSNNAKLVLIAAAELLLAMPWFILAFNESIVSGLLLLIPIGLLVHTVMVNILVRLIKPRPLPRITPDAELLNDNRTLVCVPVLITGEQALRDALDTIEMHYLASRRDCPCGVEFCVLGDFPDSDTEIKEGEPELLKLAAKLADELNAKYGNKNIFHYLHRKRSYAREDEVFMGRERKRGAVNALMQLIKKHRKTEFNCICPALEGDFNFLVVLDADTVMPAGALKKLIGAMLHPLNRPVYRNGETRPYEGYSIIAPRMASTSRSAAASRFANLISGEAGMSPYDSSVSDFFQDVFSEGCFGGKGIIDIDAFMLATDGKIPDNTVLSHDMLEGCISRAAFAEDILLYDGEPSQFFAWWKRRHRWLRGDFQLLPYLVGSQKKNVDALSKYKLLMNLISGFGNIAYFLAIVTGCIFGLPLPVLFALAAFFIDPLIGFIAAFITSFTVHPAWRPLILLIRRRILEFITLPYAFCRDADAIARSIYRMCFSHKKMLEWQTAASSAGKCKKASDYYRNLLSCMLMGLVLIVISILNIMGLMPSLKLSMLFGILFLLAPFIVRNLDSGRKKYGFSSREEELLRDAALRTWKYFDENCTADTHFLPPDNYQEEPYRGNAALTSPTNIGMALLAAVAALDMELISRERMIEFIEEMTVTIEKMEKWKGQLFNWYDIKTLAVLKPRFISSVDSGNLLASLITTAEALHELGCDELAMRLERLAEDMDFSSLYDEKRKLFHVGLEFEEGRLTASHYDLLASESRLMSFVLIAAGKVDAEHWFRLSRLMCEPSGGRTLKSWSGTMFEYLMPLILMETVPHSLQYETCRNAVLTEFLSMKDERPWGATESGYYAFDKHLNYQYKAFGNPSLSLEFRRSMPQIAAPYASLLALQIEPKLAMANLMAFDKMGGLGKYGFYEAADFDKARVGSENYRFVRSFMAHHQGMGLCAMDNALCDNALIKRFMRLAAVRANEQLLFENMPANPIRLLTYKSCIGDDRHEPRLREHSFSGRGGILSNGHYMLFMDENGHGFSKRDSFMLTRFDESLRAENGIEFYIRQGDSVHSCAGELNIDSGVLTLTARHSALKTKLTCLVSAELDCELRTLTLINCGSRKLSAEVGVFAELAMAERKVFNAHPAFTRLCVDSCFVDGTLLFRSRAKPGRGERYGYFNIIAANEIQYCCDGLASPGRLIGRAESMKKPLRSRSTTMPVEPNFTARTIVELSPGESAEVVLIAGIADSRESALAAVKQQRLRRSGAAELAALQARARLHILDMDASMFECAQRLAYSLLMGEEYGKHPESDKALYGVHNLWRFGISGDNRFILLTISDTAEHPMLRKLARIFESLREKGLNTELVMIGEYPCEYANRLKLGIESSISCMGNCTLLNGYELSQADRAFLEGTAAMRFGSCEELLGFTGGVNDTDILRRNLEVDALDELECCLPSCETLKCFNGCGGFDERGEYVIFASEESPTPLPWSNIIANENFGTLVTESGGGYTFKDNSRLMRITPWSNDAIGDASGERITVLMDGRKLEIKRCARHRVIHGFGSTSYAVKTEGMDFTLIETVDEKLPVKYYQLSMRNTDGIKREIDILLGFDFQIGDEWRFDGKLTKRYQWGIGIRNLFLDTDELAFLAVKQGSIDADSKNELLIHASCPENDETRLVFLLGMSKPDSIEDFIGKADIGSALSYHEEFCRTKLEKLMVRTDDEGFDLIVNRRLLYQVYAARLMGRTGFYQSGGAFGFRDQLQDVLALLMTDPERARNQLLRCAGVQFERGDVLHWWHELPRRDGMAAFSGVRTTITDDRLFLPYAVAEYIDSTGDNAVLDEEIRFLKDVPIPEGQHDIYQTMEQGEVIGSLYEHCIRALRCGLEFGAHGLPLMGGGDWNDGMDRVGDDGGESVLLGFLLVICLEAFAPICISRGDEQMAKRFTAEAKKLRENLEKYAWNGRCYRRAFFGDGKCLGNDDFVDCASECFAVFAGAKHSEEAFDTILEELLDNEHKLIRLLNQPFDEADPEHEVGYIRGYIPGVRENGGQYTHAAVWCVLAACRLGRADTADKLFALLNPAVHGQIELAAQYMGEPYAMAGDVYSEGRLAGRAGWSWYTGAAAWLYRAAVENILGIKKRGCNLYINPCTTMESFEVKYSFGKSLYHIRAKKLNAHSLMVNGRQAECVPLLDDGKTYEIDVCY